MTQSHSPCQMELKGQTVDWSSCPYNTPKNREALAEVADSIRIYPNEFRPDVAEWPGISFRQWLRYVMSQPTD